MLIALSKSGGDTFVNVTATNTRAGFRLGEFLRTLQDAGVMFHTRRIDDDTTATLVICVAASEKEATD